MGKSSKKTKQQAPKAAREQAPPPAAAPAEPAGTAADGMAQGDAGAPQAVDLRAVARAFVEAWRLERRVRSLEDPRLAEGVRRLLGEFEAAGCRLEDPVGTRFVDGVTFEVIGDVPQGASLKVVETIRPAVYIGGQLQVPAQVIIGSEEG
ncbi:hypothetical protein [Tepidiforma sp.]|uniref:hypothetical protein n=1 Tax=Tepidiforma sp. TaxID=2682230 RepID=UPI00260F8857|nr:hypothetical protein [Tepidiforma sp.]MCX7618480.1 hypothetical protein [Tepidiforma sp.]